MHRRHNLLYAVRKSAREVTTLAREGLGCYLGIREREARWEIRPGSWIKKTQLLTTAWKMMYFPSRLPFPNAVTLLVDFITACKRLWRLYILAGRRIQKTQYFTTMRIWTTARWIANYVNYRLLLVLILNALLSCIKLNVWY